MINFNDFTNIGKAVVDITDKITVRADKDGGIASPRLSFMSSLVTLSVAGTVAKGSVGISLISFDEAGAANMVVCNQPEIDSEGGFIFRYSFDPISLAVYKNAVSFQVNITAECDGSEFEITTAATDEMEDNAFVSASSADIVTKNAEGTTVVPVMQTDGSVVEVNAVPDKVLFIGNSILLGMHNTYGMCSSAPDKDYAYRVTEYIKKLNPSCSFAKLHGAGLEHAESVEMFEEWFYRTDNVYTGEPACKSFDSDTDLIFIQLGDNVNTDEKREAFLQTADIFVEFIKKTCPKARIIWVYGWYGIKFVFDKINQVTNKWHMETVFIRSLRVEENQSYSGMEYYNPESGEKSVVKDTWITHPGDAGMEKIAKLIINKLGI